VVHFRHDGDVAAFEAFDDPHLPQRTRAVQRLAGDVAAEVGEFLATAGSRNRNPMDMSVDVEIGIVDPDWMVEIQPRIGELTAENGNTARPGR
jgi:hypothetical protein